MVRAVRDTRNFVFLDIAAAYCCQPSYDGTLERGRSDVGGRDLTSECLQPGDDRADFGRIQLFAELIDTHQVDALGGLPTVNVASVYVPRGVPEASTVAAGAGLAGLAGLAGVRRLRQNRRIP